MKFIITAQIKAATGVRYCEVEAKDKTEALNKHNEGLSEFVIDEIEVTEIGEVSIEEDV